MRRYNFLLYPAALVVGWLVLAGCSPATTHVVVPENSQDLKRPQNAVVTISSLNMQRWTRTCGLCHIDGNAGAPKIGVSGEWQERVAQGQDILLSHTIEGIGDMPPLGYCMACDADDFVEMIAFMTAASQ